MAQRHVVNDLCVDLPFLSSPWFLLTTSIASRLVFSLHSRVEKLQSAQSARCLSARRVLLLSVHTFVNTFRAFFWRENCPRLSLRNPGLKTCAIQAPSNCRGGLRNHVVPLIAHTAELATRGSCAELIKPSRMASPSELGAIPSLFRERHEP